MLQAPGSRELRAGTYDSRKFEMTPGVVGYEVERNGLASIKAMNQTKIWPIAIAPLYTSSSMDFASPVL